MSYHRKAGELIDHINQYVWGREEFEGARTEPERQNARAACAKLGAEITEEARGLNDLRTDPA